MMRTLHRFATSALAFAVAVSAWATHIIGGDMYYDHLGGNQYQVTLRLYRDCGPDNTNNTAFDASAQIAVFTANGALFTDVVVSDPGETVVPVTLNDPCLTAPPSVCVRTTVYIHTFTLPPTPGGYTISYQRCCRTPAMVNLSGQQGLTCTITIPGPPNNVNSSPRFNDYPPIALCLDQDMSFDHSATDPDGDQLVYGLCSPFQGADNINPAPLAGPPPYDPVNWAAGYSGANPINSAPPIAIDPATGLLTVHPTLQGTFTVGVCVSEFRNGNLLGISRRDFMFRVVPCNAAVSAIIAAQGAGQACSLTQAFSNQSIGGQFWLWDFGDPSTILDVSTAQQPSYTYPSPGTYTVTLIANPGAPCADTTVADYLVAPSLQPTFTVPPPLCGPQEIEFLLAGNIGIAPTIEWSFGPGASPQTAQSNAPTVQFEPIGAQQITVTVSEFGCSGTFSANVQVHPQPVAAFAEQDSFCDTLGFTFTNESVDAASYQWDFGEPGTAADLSSQQSPSWIYGVQGYHTVTLIARNGPVCADTATQVFDAHLPPPVFFLRPPIRCPGEVALLNANGSQGSATVAWDLGLSGFPNTATSLNVQGIFPEVGTFPVTLTMTEFGCSASYTDSVTVYPMPTVDFTNGSLACVGAEFPFNALVTTATPYTLLWNLGDGTTATAEAFNHVYQDPGRYSVSLTASTSTGCVATVTRNKPGAVEVFPKPVAAFTALPDEVSIMDPRIEVTDYSSLAAEWLYTIAGEEVADSAFAYSFADPGQYTITQVVTTEHGCTDSTTRVVIVSGHFFYAPTAFTPDGDGKNESWRPSVVGAREYELAIWDRWGNEVFRTNDPEQGWDGAGYSSSVFVYWARVKEWGAYAKEYRGHFSMLR
ncbi:MAG: PKD domain-containing protein [Flavobacteriales bacterium]|nr:PKD domain-containing protein [Flavobacteriales bacterium]